jgi:hypothetical protein
MLWELFDMLDLLLVVKHEPTLGTEDLSIGLCLNVLYLSDKSFPLFALLFNHLLY